MVTSDDVLRVLSGLLTPTIAILAGYIAWRQYRTAHDKLRLDLFERRYRVYRGVMDLLSTITRDIGIPQEELGKFYVETDQKRFLFKQDLRDYLKQIHSNTIDLRQAHRLIDPSLQVEDERRSEAIETEARLLKWFAAQVDGEAARRFEPYLGFYHHL